MDRRQKEAPMKKLHRRAVLVGSLVLTLSLTVGTAAASGAGMATIFTSTGIDNPDATAAGPDRALRFTTHLTTSTRRITTPRPATHVRSAKGKRTHPGKRFQGGRCGSARWS